MIIELLHACASDSCAVFDENKGLLLVMMNGFYCENGNRDQNLMYEIQWGCGQFPSLYY